MYKKMMNFTIFLDMLGFASKIGKISNREEAEDFISYLEANFHTFTTISELHKNLPYAKYYDFKFTLISDSIVLSFTPKELDSITESEYYTESAKLFLSIYTKLSPIILLLASEKKILLRGAISNKFSYIKDTFAIGEGLVEAYKLENEKAIFPRIILSNDIINDKKFMETVKKISINNYKNRNYFISKDKDDKIFYINYLNFYIAQGEVEGIENSTRNILEGHKLAIEDIKKNLEKIEDKKSSKYLNILKKFDWIKNYHNSSIDKFKGYEKYKI